LIVNLPTYVELFCISEWLTAFVLHFLLSCFSWGSKRS